jgi:hypothetical protein
MSVPDPATLMGEIHASARAIDAGSKQLGQAIRRLAQTQETYEAAQESALILIRDEAVTAGERVPAEDLRRAMAHRRVPSEIYGAYLQNQAEVDGLKAWLRAQEAALSARQSLLSALRAELGATA